MKYEEKMSITNGINSWTCHVVSSGSVSTTSISSSGSESSWCSQFGTDIVEALLLKWLNGKLLAGHLFVNESGMHFSALYR
jgi:hypothetical protein